jgi:DNA mismatch endonuclease (patch repair protein)
MTSHLRSLQSEVSEPRGGIGSSLVHNPVGLNPAHPALQEDRDVAQHALMADVITRERRSALMSRIRGTDTRPELAVRRLVHAMGYRFRLHRRDLPGRPDLVFLSRRKVIFVHGCFWHAHSDCKAFRLPKTRRDWWQAKLTANIHRDRHNEAMLVAAGWAVLVVWECQVQSDAGALASLVGNFLGESTGPQRQHLP